MYHTCLYCTTDLGSNTIVETLPIGRRVAFDAATGRLWVVCRRCEKWNLVPFDTRLETIDACERLFRAARLRFSTDHIGIARVNEGLELVRIGAAQRPEFAAWRYGDQFGRRRWRYAFRIAGLATAGVALVVGGSELARLVGLSGGVGFQLVNPVRTAYLENRVVVRITTLDDEPSIVTNEQDCSNASGDGRMSSPPSPTPSPSPTTSTPASGVRKRAETALSFSLLPSYFSL